MSTPSENLQPAPWRDILSSHLEQTPGYKFTIATIGYNAQQRPVPRVRTCGCRGFFPELELHHKGQEAMDQQVEGGGNPPVFESDMLSFTTDARMDKLPQLESSGHAIEAVFWLKDLMTQWRIKGTAYAIGNPSGEDAEEEKTSRNEIRKALRVKGVMTVTSQSGHGKRLSQNTLQTTPLSQEVLSETLTLDNLDPQLPANRISN
ncbi:uncharacterized protein N7487_007398 [Penicillium crustosum]|uniref:uncharacterized protein n=1 Tax=Penicillium crustosum TaxID=36656 RepID=UPI002389CB52|nr:uncharacterized protein N7487_007398 [Penicillium crustosum]KAJ5401502.1 hypothetical protein N7487_007398 [Penicillium crustosum]